MNSIKNKNILIIGGTGSWAYGVIQELLGRGVNKIRIFARNEYRMVKTLQKFENSCVEAVIGDIRDVRAVKNAMKDCQIVFELAALKHVPICETMPFEAIETNIIGTKNVIQCAEESQVEKVIYVSTDKAVNANCTYGCTKLLGEKLFLSADSRQLNTKYIVFRGGNLLGSSGSVLPIFQNQIKDTGSVTLTDEKMSRFFITIERASKLLVDVAEKGAGGEIFLPVMHSISIKNIALYLLRKNNLSPDNIRLVGIRPGEKLHEQMIAESEMDYLYQLNDALVLIDKTDAHGWRANAFVKKAVGYRFNSAQDILNYADTEKFLKAANF